MNELLTPGPGSEHPGPALTVCLYLISPKPQVPHPGALCYWWGGPASRGAREVETADGPYAPPALRTVRNGSFLRHCPGNAGQAQLDGENRPTLRHPGLVLRAWSWSTEGSAGIGPLCDTRLQKQPCPLPKLSFLLSSYFPSDFLGFQYCGHECSSQCQPEASHTAGGTQ